MLEVTVYETNVHVLCSVCTWLTMRITSDLLQSINQSERVKVTNVTNTVLMNER